MNTKICTKCNESKSLDQFYLKKGSPRSSCKSCHAKYYRIQYHEKNDEYRARNKRWRNANPEREAGRFLKNRYGLSVSDRENLLKSQDYKCAICLKEQEVEREFHIDHCHSTGVIRGILCAKCNAGLGFFRDNIDFLSKAIEYLKR